MALRTRYLVAEYHSVKPISTDRYDGQCNHSADIKDVTDVCVESPHHHIMAPVAAARRGRIVVPAPALVMVTMPRKDPLPQQRRATVRVTILGTPMPAPMQVSVRLVLSTLE
ncbi:hypothetical protein NDU88_007761 [Pleurodeles waltl]|uniref:Uncharacterized protein n=1 Tax=Pleurodeles waltl TaxID=8319 RepID=A0AAV7QMS9_PLEWA|nr:hypothetical protein NDU88_007761 [Pleurodeles waltl]